jgi:hypothetical protein
MTFSYRGLRDEQDLPQLEPGSVVLVAAVAFGLERFATSPLGKGGQRGVLAAAINLPQPLLSKEGSSTVRDLNLKAITRKYENGDGRGFPPYHPRMMVTQTKKNIGRGHRIDKFSADNGYFSEDNVTWIEKQRTDGYIATGRLKHNEQVPPFPRGRPPDVLTVKERMARKLRTKKGRKTYAQRKWITEPVFGQIKRGLGFTQFLLNGLDKIRSEWRMVCMAHNLRKLWTTT